MTRITIVTDAWHPQVNGVVRTLEHTIRELEALGVDVSLVTPADFRTVPLPSYPEIRIALAGASAVGRLIEAFAPEHVHIATEGPLGMATRRWCLKHGVAFTTSYHTRFPEYLAARLPIPEDWIYALVRRFHNAGAGCMVATDTLASELSRRGFQNLQRWSRGIDAGLFRPRPAGETPYDLPRPIFVNVGRVAPEKNLEAFLALELPGSKVVVGDGPMKPALQKRYPEVQFVGARFGEDLARHYSGADVLVFPSRTDTFGNVILEALASGVPVAAYPVMGPLDILSGTQAGALDDDLRAACLSALGMSREAARSLALSYSWASGTRQFLDNIRRAMKDDNGRFNPIQAGKPA